MILHLNAKDTPPNHDGCLEIPVELANGDSLTIHMGEETRIKLRELLRTKLANERRDRPLKQQIHYS